MLIIKETKLSTDKQRLGRMLKALGNPIRFQIMEFLFSRHILMTYEIVQGLYLAQSTVSQHLKILAQAGLIRGEMVGPATRYSVDQEGVRWLKNQVAHWLPEHRIPDDVADS